MFSLELNSIRKKFKNLHNNSTTSTLLKIIFLRMSEGVDWFYVPSLPANSPQMLQRTYSRV